jgi:hypothetical protein
MINSKRIDSLGVVDVPADTLWGAPRSLEDFSIGKDLITRGDDHRPYHLVVGLLLAAIAVDLTAGGALCFPDSPKPRRASRPRSARGAATASLSGFAAVLSQRRNEPGA